MADNYNKSDLNKLYNSRVTNAEYVERPLGSFGSSTSSASAGSGLGFNHAGVRVTTETGDQYLLHKGPGFGNSSDTVVTSAKNMSSQWQTTREAPVSDKTVGDFMKHGQPDTSYNLLSSNCQHAANSMWRNNTKK